jgi:hypothetical protein
MQHGTHARQREPMTSARRLQLLSALADGDLATISTLFDEFASRAFPVFRCSTEFPLLLKSSHSYEYTIDLVKALIGASSRGLQLIAPLLDSITQIA